MTAFRRRQQRRDNGGRRPRVGRGDTMPWVYNPHTGGVKIPPAVKKRTEQRIRAYAEQHYAGKYIRLDVRFRGALCYIDACIEPAEPTPELLRLTGETREAFL